MQNDAPFVQSGTVQICGDKSSVISLVLEKRAQGMWNCIGKYETKPNIRHYIFSMRGDKEYMSWTRQYPRTIQAVHKWLTDNLIST